jgi:hypothetical protein
MAPGGTRTAVFVGDGLTATLNTSQDATAQVLCVSNPTLSPQSFTPSQHWDAAGERNVYFVAGEMQTSASEHGPPTCTVPAESYVCLCVSEQPFADA